MGKKPRITLAQFRAMQQQSQYSAGSIAALIERHIREMNGLDTGKPVKTLGTSHEFILRALQRMPIGGVMGNEFAKHHLIDHCKMRREKVCPATVQQDVQYLDGVLKYARSAWEDCKNVAVLTIPDAKPFLKMHDLIGKSTPRERRPLPEETERLLDYFATPKKKNKKAIDMVRMTLWQLYSGRRVGESCMLLWEDWNREDQTILVRKMKDPKRRDKSKVVALTVEAQAFLVALWEIRDPIEPRIFAFNSKSVGAAYTRAKKALGIVDLHLHDSRRDCGTRLVEDKGYSSAQAILVTGHETVHVFERTYLRQKPELFKLGPKGQQERIAA